MKMKSRNSLILTSQGQYGEPIIVEYRGVFEYENEEADKKEDEESSNDIKGDAAEEGQCLTWQLLNNLDCVLI